MSILRPWPSTRIERRWKSKRAPTPTKRRRTKPRRKARRFRSASAAKRCSVFGSPGIPRSRSPPRAQRRTTENPAAWKHATVERDDTPKREDEGDPADQPNSIDQLFEALTTDPGDEPNAEPRGRPAPGVLPDRALLAAHAPTGMHSLAGKRDEPPHSLDELVALVSAGTPVNLMVVAADIRKSTFVMKEALDFTGFAAAISSYVDATKKFIGQHGGWFDKFTGDGLLAYWMYGQSRESKRRASASVLHSVEGMLLQFDRRVVPLLRANSRNFPSGVGLSVGVDCGPTHLVKIAEDLTIVGPSVVGAVRMVGCSGPWECIANVGMGSFLRANLNLPHLGGVSRQFRPTKEYERQEVYAVKLNGFEPPAEG